MGIGEGVFTSPTTFAQADWEDRVFKLKELSLENASFSLARNASFMGQLSSINSSIVLGSKELYIDKKDGENVSTKISSGNNSALENPSYTAGNTMRFEQDLLKGQSLNTGVKFIGKLELYNSKASIDNIDMQADIKAHSGTNDISVLNSNIKGNIENLSSLNLRLSNTTFYGDIKNTNELELSSNTYINGSILTKTLKATDSIFTLDIDLAKQSTQSISSTQNSEGKNNTLRLNFTSFANENLQSLVLASLKDPSMQINEDFFKVEKISAGFSQYLPNLIFERKDDEAQWSLEKTDNSYFNKAPNTETINKSNALFNQVLLSYVIEWNNLQKRMGELRENPNSVGTWMRSFGGGNSDSIYKGNFFELQLGSDYRFELDYADLYLGTMLNYTQNDIKGDGLKANSKGYGLGAYASLLFANEAYLDTVLRYVYKKHSVNASFIPSISFQNSLLNDSSGANTFLFSIEAGHRLYLQSFFNYGFLKDFYVEPQLELIAGHLQGMQWQNETVSLELLSLNALSIKPALFFGKKIFP